ncbi:MAG: hypothetical protein CMP81_25310 [Fulvimarina sp.]|nr:hypothetical protein [Fulvimarina sp.]
MLVGAGVWVFTPLMTVLVGLHDDDQVRAAPIRMISAITSGAAFLAAGAIIQAKGEVRGLTTGASLWMAGSVGLACGLGEYLLALMAVGATLCRAIAGSPVRALTGSRRAGLRSPTARRSAAPPRRPRVRQLRRRSGRSRQLQRPVAPAGTSDRSAPADL